MDSSVKVGVRIRPLLPKEQHQQVALNNYDEESIQFKGQTFTYDHVFGSELSQQELYQNTAAPMLRSFLEGYNVTIMAYGQTGSGKTFTMGTADASHTDPEVQGLIPRFVHDLYENLALIAKKETLEAKVRVSFLEIYGEDVFDLTHCDALRGLSGDRPSLPVRENDAGHVFVQGLQEINVSDAAEALHVLNTGTKNRITASTAMNSGSSRSHAVYTISLEQSITTDDDTQQMRSKLTFVDLAGSERIKRTGAEGQRMKEGIQINSGLFNLGQVINGLADDQRIKQGNKAQHIPYRNSKLTHLLKDALGGNSQTLFLACVSPAESNESETYSTLSYARQARNIRNKPIKNMDKTQLELRRLRCAVKAWMLTALTEKFNANNNANDVSISDMLLSPSDRSERKYEDIFDKPEVKEYISNMNQKIDVILQGHVPTPRKVRLSVLHSPFTGRRPPLSAATTAISSATKRLFHDEEESVTNAAAHTKQRRVSIIDSGALQHISEQPEETEQLLSRMIEIVHKEKEQLKSADDSSSDSEELSDVDAEITEKEEILQKLMDAVKGFSALKQEYELLVHEITVLETERKELEISLEKATKQTTTANPVAVEKLKERFLKVKEELTKMKQEKQSKEHAYRIVEKESKQCEQLQRELRKLKEIKIQLMKTQKSQNQQHLKFKKESQSKLNVLKKLDVKKQKQMNCLKSELMKKQRVLGHKEREITRIQSKLKACEEHITQLLRIQNRGRGKLLEKSNSNVKEADRSSGSMSASEAEHYSTSKNILHNLISDRIECKYRKMQIDAKTITIKELQEELAEEVSELEKCNAEKQSWLKENEVIDELTRQEKIAQFDNEIHSAEANVDRITNELQMHRADLSELSSSLQQEESSTCWEDIGKNVIVGCSLTQLQHLLYESLEEKSELLSKQRSFTDSIVQYKEKAESAEDRIAELEEQVATMTKELKIKLDEVEKTRVHDMWILLQSKTSAADDMANSIIYKRTQELESTLNAMVTQEYMLKEENGNLKSENEKLRYQLKESALSASSPSNATAELNTVWDELGYSYSDREAYINDIATIQQSKQAEILLDMQQLLRNSIAEEDHLHSEIEVLCNIMDLSENDYISSAFPLLQKIEELKKSSTNLHTEFDAKLKQITAMKSKLQYLLTDMGLAPNELQPSLAKLHKSYFDTSATSAEIAASLLSQGIMLSVADIGNWEQSIRQLSIVHANNVARVTDLHHEALSLCQQLSISNNEQLLAMELGCDDIPQALVLLTMEALLHNTSLVLPGNPQLILHLERVIMTLQTTKVNRESVAKQLVAFVSHMKQYLTFDVSADLATVLSAATAPFSSADLRMLQNIITALPAIVEDNSASLQSRLRCLCTELGITSEHFESRISQLLSSKQQLDELVTFDDIVTSVHDFVMFIDETWVKDVANDLQSIWQAHRQSMLHVLLLLSEANRMEKYIELSKDMQKYDNQLVKHIHEMEEFEQSSKQDRMKVLSGNSKALVEEEKFRKSGKRKYETLTEKLIQAANQTTQYSEDGTLNTSSLSSHAQSVLKGKVNERIELMHLHTTTHGTRRWSGERDLDTENKGTNIGTTEISGKKSMKEVSTPRGAVKPKVGVTLLGTKK